MLEAFDHPQPAGTYRVVVEEEAIPGLTFLAYHRTATMLHLPALSVCDRPSELCFTSAAELNAALEADEQA
jgi:hypothetical protein